MKQNAHNASGHYCTTVHRVRSVNSHSIKECELSFHQTSYKRYTTMCDVYIIHIQGATVCYIHPPEKRKTVTQPPHHPTLPPPIQQSNCSLPTHVYYASMSLTFIGRHVFATTLVLALHEGEAPREREVLFLVLVFGCCCMAAVLLEKTLLRQ